MPSDQYHRIAEMLRARRGPRELDVEQVRRRLEGTTSLFPVPDDVAFETVVDGEVRGEWGAGSDAGGERAILLLHGGGYIAGSPRTHRNLAGRVALAARCRTFSVDYRLAPEHPFPAAVDDTVRAYAWLLAQGLPADRIALVGESAGGGLVVAGLLRARERGLPLAACAVCLSPFVDLAVTGGSAVALEDADLMLSRRGLLAVARLYLGAADPAEPLASPIYADLAGFPPLLVQVGTAEVLLDDARRLAVRARASGVEVVHEEWDAMFHAFQLLAGFMPEADQAVERIGAFVRDKLG